MTVPVAVPHETLKAPLLSVAGTPLMLDGIPGGLATITCLVLLVAVQVGMYGGIGRIVQ